MATYLFKLITLVVQMTDILPSIMPQGNIFLKLNPDDDGNCFGSPALCSLRPESGLLKLNKVQFGLLSYVFKINVMSGIVCSHEILVTVQQHTGDQS